VIAVSSSSRSFASLGKYLVVGRDHVESGRVAWATSRNLPTDDPELAAKIMRATAAQNTRVDKPVYHVVLSFDPGDVVDRATMEKVADELLRELKLQGHQTIIVAHCDRQHPHMHILINRVHPETGMAWDRWKDYNAIQRVLRGQEQSLSVRVVDPSVDIAPGSATRDLALGDAGSGASLPQDRVSKVARDLEALGGQDANASARAKAQKELTAAQANGERIDDLLERESRARSKFESSLREAYVDPQCAKETFFQRASQTGEKAAAAEMRVNPEAFGRLNAQAFERRGQSRAAAEESARGAAREGAGHGAELVGTRREAARSIRTRDNHDRPVDIRIELDQSGAREEARGRIDAARQRVRDLGRVSNGVAGRELEIRIGSALRRLTPPEVERLRQTLSPEHWSLANKLKHLVRDAVLGRDMDA
jgi:hypothetical protein